MCVEYARCSAFLNSLRLACEAMTVSSVANNSVREEQRSSSTIFIENVFNENRKVFSSKTFLRFH